MARTQLTGSGQVSVEDVTIEAPGLSGDLVVEAGGGPATRDADNRLPDQLRLAVNRHRGRVRRTIRIESPSDTDTGGDAATRSPATRGGAASRARPAPIRVAVPAPRPGRAQVLLSRDEHGIVTWHLPTPVTRGDPLADGRDVFEVPRALSGPATRSLGISKILQVITFPIAKVGADFIEFKVRDWDKAKHPYALRFFGADRSQTQIDDAGWKGLAAGRVLLIVHGTFDTVSGCLSRLPDATLGELHQRYGGRVLGFDHPTLAESPIDNARQLLTLVGDHALDVDIVCHSRGGLVTRAIAERPRDLDTVGKKLRVGTAVLVGSTTNGTWLADIGHWNDLIDRISTLLSFAPVPAAVDALETVFGLVRSLAVETDHNLAGLDAMAPTRPYLAEVNKQPKLGAGGSYRAITSDYEPTDPALKAFFADELKDEVVFKGPNDGMVGVDEIRGDAIPSPFPVTERLDFGSADGVEHANYFAQARTSTALLGWLKG